MPVAPSDLIPYAAVGRPWDEVSQAGGAMDPTTRVTFDPLAASDELEVVSDDNDDDDQEVTVYARAVNGQIVSQTVTLDGTTPVAFNTLGVVERVLSIELDSAADGNVTVRRDGDAGDVAVIPPGERGVTRMFVGAISSPDAGKVYYEKFFWYNSHASLAALGAIISEQSGGAAALIDFALEAAKDGSQSIADRLTEPSGSLTFDSDPKAVVGGDLEEETAQGVWVRLTLAQGNAPVKDVWNTRIAFSST